MSLAAVLDAATDDTLLAIAVALPTPADATELYRALQLFKIANGLWLTRVLSIGYVLIQPFLGLLLTVGLLGPARPP
jgi:hypothetical protein